LQANICFSALELEDLLNDPREFDAFFEQLEVVNKIRNIRDELRDTNQAIASKLICSSSSLSFTHSFHLMMLSEENIQKGEEIATLKFIIEEKKTEYNEKRQAYEKKKELQKELAMVSCLSREESFSCYATHITIVIFVKQQRYRPERLAEELRRASDEIEKESDELASAFLDSQLELKEFVKLYLPKRILLHQRATKRDGLLLSLKS